MTEWSNLELPDFGSLPEGEDPVEPADHTSSLSPLQLPDTEVPAAADALTAMAAPSGDSILTAVAHKGQLEIQLSSPTSLFTDLVANADYHALVIKDPAVGPLLDAFHKGTSDLWEEEGSLRIGTLPEGDSESFASLLHQMQKRTPDSKVLLTPKRNVPSQVDAHFIGWVKRLIGQLEFSDPQRKIITEAGLIHCLARFRQADPGSAGSKTAVSSYSRLLACLHQEPAILTMLKSMYFRTAAMADARIAAEGEGAQVLTLVDLFCDRFKPEHSLQRALVKGLERELNLLSGQLFSPRVVGAFLALLEADLPAIEADDHKNRVLVYTDLLDNIFPLEARLRSEGFQVFTTESLETCMQINRRKHPDIIILRLRAQPSIVIKAIHYLLSNGVDLTTTPSYLLVDGQHVDRLTGLLALGIEDILDLKGRLDPVILKIKKVRSRLKNTARTSLVEQVRDSGSSGNLSDMNLIDLLQALGPSQRTARVTLHPMDSACEPLSLYLNKGSIIFAQLDDLVGQAAIHRAMGWNQGTWLVEQMTDADLPSPNNDISNEAILIEGCRLLDESARQAETPQP